MTRTSEYITVGLMELMDGMALRNDVGDAVGLGRQACVAGVGKIEGGWQRYGWGYRRVALVRYSVALSA
jgi:hypothetical protein